MPTAAIYAHSSTVGPYGNSIENQVRSCRRAAAKEGHVVADRFIYCDYALSGNRNGPVSRRKWQMLVDAIDTKQIDILYIEDVLRATLDIYDGIKLMSFVENHNLRVVTSDGLDTAQSNWKSKWLTQLLKAGIKSEESAVRVINGMLGKLERGYQVSKAPFGFRTVHDKTPEGVEVGIKWAIECKEAELIQAMYSQRESGKTYAQIALQLNTLKAPVPCPLRCKAFAYWRPTTVQRILANKIYKGVFVWNGSETSKPRAMDGGKNSVQREFERPQLRLVSDETWESCKSPKKIPSALASHVRINLTTGGQR